MTLSARLAPLNVRNRTDREEASAQAAKVLHEFLTINRADLIERCRLKVIKRLAPKVTDAELTHGIPAFLDQLIKTLQVERTAEPLLSRRVSGPAGGGPAVSEIGATATLHGQIGRAHV